MSGLPRTYDTWKTTNPADEFLGPEPDEEEDIPSEELESIELGTVWPDESLPCNWEHMSGECLYCRAQIGEECGWDGNRGRSE